MSNRDVRECLKHNVEFLATGRTSPGALEEDQDAAACRCKGSRGIGKLKRVGRSGVLF